MAQDQSASIQVITRVDDNTSEDSKNLNDRVQLVTNTLDVDTLHRNFTQFVDSMQSIIEKKMDDNASFQLNEIQFSAEITASGDFKLLGTGVGVRSSSMITFVLQRKGFGR